MICRDEIYAKLYRAANINQKSLVPNFTTQNDF